MIKIFKFFVILLVLFWGTLFLNSIDSHASSQKLAVNPAGYDDMGAILARNGLNFDQLQEVDLKNFDKIKNYDAIYINCTDSIYTEIASPEDAKAIRDFVRGGGIVYASDFAASVIEAAFPDRIDFYDSGNSESTDGYYNEANDASKGGAGVVEAQITDSGLASVLGKKSISIDFNLSGWVVIKSVGPGVRVYMKGPVPFMDESQGTEIKEDVPYVASFSEGDGEVIFTSFHNEVQNTADVEKVLDWFATRTRAGKLAQETRKIAIKDKGNKVLQEIVDTASDSEKSYEFKASGKADFGVVVNFDGENLTITISDPTGSAVRSETVSSTPFILNKIDASAGTYTFKIKGEKTGSSSLPFVLDVFGPQEAAVDSIVDEGLGESKASAWGTKKTIVVAASFFIILALVYYFFKKSGKIGTVSKKPKK